MKSHTRILLVMLLFIFTVMNPLTGKAEETPVSITGSSVLTPKQLGDYVLLNNPEPQLVNLSIYGLADLYISIGRMEGIRGDIAFAQAIHETGYFRFGNDVSYTQNNYSGIGAVGGGAAGASFRTPEEGVRAQIQHLKAYANTEDLVTEKIDPRFDYVKRGIAPNWQDLNGKWAVPGTNYGQNILSIFEKIKASDLQIPNVDNSVTHKLPVATLYLKYDTPFIGPDGTVVKHLKGNQSYKVYGTIGNHYNLGGNYRVAANSSRMSLFIGRLYIPDNTSVLYKPTGEKHRNLKVGETIKVYSFDDQAYYVGGGYFVKKNPGLSLYKGVVSIQQNQTPLYDREGNVVRLLTRGQQFRVYQIKGTKLEVGSGHYIVYKSTQTTYTNY